MEVRRKISKKKFEVYDLGGVKAVAVKPLGDNALRAFFILSAVTLMGLLVLRPDSPAREEVTSDDAMQEAKPAAKEIETPFEMTPVPEPSATMLLALASLALLRRRR